ncbi:MAG: hypothetical protein OHK003_02850 [Anaerolineales bacterium]
MLNSIAWTVVSRYIAQGVAVLSNILLARYLGADGFGEYALASSVLLIGNAFSNFGMDMILIRRLVSENCTSLLADGLWLQLFLSVIYIAGVFIFNLFVPIPLSLKIYILALLPLSFYSIFTIKVRAYQQMNVFSITQMLMAFFQLLAVFILWFLREDVGKFVLLLLVSSILVAFWGFTNHVLHITTWRFSLSSSLALLKSSSHMAVIGTLRLVYEKITVTLLPALAGLSMTGIFSSASRVMDAGKLGHFSAFTAIYPEMARNEGFAKNLRGLRPLLGTALLISTLLFLLASPIVLILFGGGFLSAVPLLKILTWIICPYVISTYASLGLAALGIEKPVLKSLLFALTSLLILLVTLTLRFGLMGAAAAVLSAEMIHAALLWQQWRKHAPSKFP